MLLRNLQKLKKVSAKIIIEILIFCSNPVVVQVVLFKVSWLTLKLIVKVVCIVKIIFNLVFTYHWLL